jgi:plastocyanin domain-containing protein
MTIRTIAIAIIAGIGLAGTLASAQCTVCFGAQNAAVLTAKKTVQKFTIVIDGGYKPSSITAKVGKPLMLTFYRKETTGCGDKVVFKSLGITKSVASGHKVLVKFTPKKAGTIKFTCGMGMYKGQIVVK